MMIACLLSPRKNETAAVPANRISTALRSWRPSTAIALTRWVRTALGPWRCNRADASAPDSPSAELSSPRSTSSRGAEAARPTPSACSLTGRARSARAVTNSVLVHAPPLCQLRVAVIPGLAEAQLWRPHGMPDPPGRYLRCRRCRAGVHAAADDVFDEDRDESLDRCIDELPSGLLAPPRDLGGALGVAAPLVTSQLGCHLGHGSGSGPLGLAGRSDTTAGAFRCLVQFFSANLFAGVGRDDVQCDATTVAADQDHTGRLLGGEALQMDCQAGDLRPAAGPTCRGCTWT